MHIRSKLTRGEIREVEKIYACRAIVDLIIEGSESEKLAWQAWNILRAEDETGTGKIWLEDPLVLQFVHRDGLILDYGAGLFWDVSQSTGTLYLYGYRKVLVMLHRKYFQAMSARKGKEMVNKGARHE